MDIISQLQDQVNKIAFLAFNTLGSLQRDAPSARLSQNYPDPQAAPPAPAPAPAPAPPGAPPGTAAQPIPPPPADQAPEMASALTKAAMEFDALVAALPIEGGESAQLKRIAELQVCLVVHLPGLTCLVQAENDEVAKQLRLELDAAGNVKETENAKTKMIW